MQVSPTTSQVEVHLERIHQVAAQLVREVHQAQVKALNATLHSQYADWQAGKFCERVLHPQRIAVLRQATDDQLEARRKFICRLSERGYRTETLRIDRVLRERALSQNKKTIPPEMVAL